MKQSILFAFLLFMAGEIKAQVKDSTVLIRTTLTDLKTSIKVKTFSDSIYTHLLNENTDAIMHVNYNPRTKAFSFYFKSAYRASLLQWIARYDAATRRSKK